MDGNFVIKVTIHIKKVVRESRNLGPSETAPFGCRYGEELARSQKSKALRARHSISMHVMLFRP